MAVPSENFDLITSGELDADSPLKEDTLQKIRTSLIHLEEWLGMDYTAAQNHDHDGANSKQIPALADYSLGDALMMNADTERSGVETSYTKYKEIVVARTGTLRIKFDLRAQGAGDSVRGIIYRNGASEGVEKTTIGASWETHTDDTVTTWVAGDTCELWLKRVSGTTWYARNFRLYSGSMLQELVNLD